MSSLLRVAALAALALGLGPASRAAELFPFVLPWDDASPGITDLSGWHEKPAGGKGFVSVKDGHLFAGEKRLRIFGVNMCFGANFPKKEVAEKIAARMAKFGINCVRFHHMDMMNAPGGIFAKDGRTLDPGQLDRLDFFIAKLKERGIYTDLNLHVSRTYPDRPKSEKAGNANFDKGVDNFSAAQIALQKDYARDLLTHVNPYTGNAYTDEPAVALIEINNENALLDEWHGGRLDTIAAPYRAELGALWTAWLKKQYGDDAKLTAAWVNGAREAGPELLVNGDDLKQLEAWKLEKHGGAEGGAVVVGAGAGRSMVMRIEVWKPGTELWHVQWSQAGLAFRAGETYALTFRARADAKRKIAVNAAQAHEPWKVLASRSIELTSEWTDHTVLLRPDAADDNARISFSNLSRANTHYEIGELSLRIAGIDATVPRDADGGVTPFKKADLAGRTEAAQRDWFQFLWETEDAYWTGMQRFLKEELKARPLIVGTQLGWSPFPIQAKMDVIDSHAYWQHPHFPGGDWDPVNWTVKNLPMAGVPGGGTLATLALGRVAGKPFLVTEYNHSAPNTYSAETFPLLCAFAAMQDWDGIFAFAYSHRGDSWDQGYFSSFFDIDRHPVKMATLPGALATWLRADVQAAKGRRINGVSLESALAIGREAGPRPGAGGSGITRETTMLVRTGVTLLAHEGEAIGSSVRSSGGAFGSVLGEWTWDAERRAVRIDAPRSKGAIGAMPAGEAITLGGLTITPGETRQGWAAIQLTVVEGDDFATAKRILVTATGHAENTGMQWNDAEKTSVGRNWGRAPSLVEGIAAKIQLPGSRKWQAWALDERGQRREAIPVADGALVIGPEHRTLWYEVAAE